MQLESRRSPKNHILEILIPFFGVLEPYKISILPVTAILLAAVILFRNKGKICLSKALAPFAVFVGYMVVRDVFHMFFSVSDPLSAQMNRLIEKTVLYVLIFAACGNGFDEKALFRWWKIAGLIFGAGMIYHVFQLLVLGQQIRPINLIPGYDISHDPNMTYDRPTSFFSEPASYVVTMMPLLFLSLKRRSFIWAALSTFLIAISTSTVGVLLCGVLWLSFILMEKKSFKITVLYTAFVVLFVVLFLRLPIFADALQKVEDVSAGESTWGSRVEGPFQMIGAMKWQEFPLGTSLVDTTQFVLQRLEHFPRDSAPYQSAASDSTVFLNSVALVIFRYGLFGLWLFLRTFKGKFSRTFGGRMYAIMLVVAAFGQGAIVAPGVPLIVLLLYATNPDTGLPNPKNEHLGGNGL